MARKIISMLFGVWLAAGMLPVQARPDSYENGVHYRTVSTHLQEETAGRSHVCEVFWYQCPHCYALEPKLSAWKDTLPDTVDFIRSPVIWDRAAREYARLYFTAEQLGVTEAMHERLFKAIHQQGYHILADDRAEVFFAELGVEKARFNKAVQSFAVDNRVRQAEAMQREAGVRSVPALIVNGQYLVETNEAVRTHEEMLKVVDYLLSLDQS